MQQTENYKKYISKYVVLIWTDGSLKLDLYGVENKEINLGVEQNPSMFKNCWCICVHVVYKLSSFLLLDGRQRNPEDGSVEVSSSSSSAATASAPSCPTEGADHPATAAEGSAEASTNGKPKTNYFIKLSTNDTSRDTGFGVFGSFTDTKGNFGKKQNGATEENYFLQFAKVDSRYDTFENIDLK